MALSLRLEDIWITKERFREMLLSYGYTPEVLAYIEAKAKADDHWRERAQKQFIEFRKYLDDPAWDAAEEILSLPSSGDKPSKAQNHQSSVSEPAYAARKVA